MHIIKENVVSLQPLTLKAAEWSFPDMASGCSAVGSALRSGRRGRQFESGHPDKKPAKVFLSGLPFICTVSSISRLPFL